MTIWEAGFAQHLLGVLKNPTDIASVQSFYECFRHDEKIVRQMEKNLLSNEAFRALYDQWYLPKKYTLDDLQTLPQGAFGRIYADHMKRNNLSVDFISEFGGRDVLSYLWVRAGHVHDIGHVITGLDTSIPGEVALKGFEIGQYRSPASSALLGSLMIGLPSMAPEIVGTMMENICLGYEYGKRCPLLMAIRWDQEWETPMPALRKKYGLPEATGAIQF